MKKEIKELRVKIDGLAQLGQTLENYPSCGIIGCTECGLTTSKEVSKAIDSLYLAKAWLGKVLGELGNENPYGSGYRTKENIKPTADTDKVKVDEKHWYKMSDVVNQEWIEKQTTHIEKVDWLRQEIEKLTNKVKNIPTYKYEMSEVPNNTPIEWKASREFAIARTNAYNYLCEARFWLGFELQRIKEND